MSIRLKPEHRRAIEAHGEETYPYECCGLILGHVVDGAKIVEEVGVVTNARLDSQHNRYLIPPDEVVKGDQYARQRGLDIIGFYHSHPNVAAVPSEYDRDHAWPWYSYVIVSIKQRTADGFRSWLLRDDRSQFDEEEVIMAQPSRESGG